MSCIGLLNGTYFDFNNLDNNEIDLESLAKGLSQINRFTGQTEFPYSVAQHSILVSRLVQSQDPEVKLAALMHDAHEAVIGDISTPVKQFLKSSDEFQRLEGRAQAYFAIKFGFAIEYAHGPVVKQADLLALYIERRTLLPKSSEDRWTCDPDPFMREQVEGFTIDRWSSHMAAKLFIQNYNNLMRLVQEKRNG